MKITDTYPALLTSYDGSAFSLERWRTYVDAALPGLAETLFADVKRCLEAGFSWETDYLPVLNAVAAGDGLREKAHDSFCRATEDLERVVSERFGKCLDVDLVFYLGLCNGAGWATEYRGRPCVLLGIEKIIELNWCGVDDMRALVYHELGHIYQGQYGTLDRTFACGEDTFLWQLFTEGVAMYFEQTLVGDPDYYHQDRDGWKQWCEDHFEEIKADFYRDLQTMTSANQRHFGDWASYHGHGDVGYYLGCRFVRFALDRYELDVLIRFDITAVTELFRQFVGAAVCP